MNSRGPGVAVPIAMTIITANPISLIIGLPIKVAGEVTGRNALEGVSRRIVDKIAVELEKKFEAQGWIDWGGRDRAGGPGSCDRPGCRAVDRVSRGNRGDRLRLAWRGPDINFLERHLSPDERLGEILFGLIMTLTFTLGAGFVLHDEPDAARAILEAVLGCNVAWGIIDGVLLILARAFERSRPARLGLALRRAGPGADPLEPIATELDEILAPLVEPSVRRSLYASIAERVRDARPDPFRIPIGDLLAAVGVFWIVFCSSLPAILPFLFLSEPWLAMRVSNILLLSFLFFVGFRWGRMTSESPWRAACAVTSVGSILVVVAIALGG